MQHHDTECTYLVNTRSEFYEFQTNWLIDYGELKEGIIAAIYTQCIM